MNISSYSLGDKVAAAASESIKKLPNLEALQARDNRLTDRSLSLLCASLPARLHSLDLAGNRMGTAGMGALAISIAKHETIRRLDLEGNRLSIGMTRLLAGALCQNESITHLLLPRVSLTSQGAILLADAVASSKSLQELGLSWNHIGPPGIAAIAGALSRNASIEALDLSWNAWGTQTADVAAEALGRSLASNTTLVHLDLSHNRLTSRHCSLLQTGLASNHSLCGLHMEGNELGVNAKGFLAADSSNHDPHGSHVFTRIVGHPRVVERPQWLQSRNCWICERWREVAFVYRNGISGPEAKTVRLHADFDRWAGDIMAYHAGKGVHQLWRMVPPGKRFYFFSVVEYTEDERERLMKETNRPASEDMPGRVEAAVSNDAEVDLDSPRTMEAIVRTKRALPPVHHPRQIDVQLHGGVPTVSVDGPACLLDIAAASSSEVLALPPAILASLGTSLNVAHIKGEEHIGKRARPRQGPNAKLEMWTFAKSVFASFVQDTDALLTRCFEADWAQNKIPRFIKDEDEIERVKEAMRTIYPQLKVVFKYFAGVGETEVGCIGWNSFTEFCIQGRIPDAAGCQLKTIDTIFIGTNVSMTKNERNPERALVRFQLLEAVVRLAVAKYAPAKLNPSQAVRRLNEEHVLPTCDNYHWMGQRFRDEHLYTEEVDAVYKAHLADLTSLYRANSGSECIPGQARFMSLSEWTALLDRTGLVGAAFTARDVRHAFLFSMMTVVDEMQTDRHTEMSFVEFLEAVGRMGYFLKPHKLDASSGLGRTSEGAEGEAEAKEQHEGGQMAEAGSSVGGPPARDAAGELAEALRKGLDRKPLHDKLARWIPTLCSMGRASRERGR